MGYTTDFIGHINIAPPLNEAEQHYLLAFAGSRRYDRPGGPYEVPGNPGAERGDPVMDINRYNAVAPGQPSLWCGWQPGWCGDCLAYDGREKFYGATDWLAYLIDNFLAPHAAAAQSGLAYFEQFTFDHVLDGIVAACQRDTSELYLINVEHNAVNKQILAPRDARFEDVGLLPYEQPIDDGRERRRRA